MKRLVAYYQNEVLYFDIPKGGEVDDGGNVVEVRDKKGRTVACVIEPRAWEITKATP